jgi:hypothetical protein
MGIAMEVLGLCDEFSCKNRFKFGKDLDLFVTWKLRQHTMKLCDELSSQNNFGFVFVMNLEFM